MNGRSTPGIQTPLFSRFVNLSSTFGNAEMDVVDRKIVPMLEGKDFLVRHTERLRPAFAQRFADSI